MKIDRVKATIRYSQDTGHGWKSLEIGAEATVDEREKWEPALAHLYADLGQQLKGLWANGQKPTGASDNSKQAQTPAHWCAEHGAEFKKFEKDGRVWFSHKTPEGKWCCPGLGVLALLGQARRYWHSRMALSWPQLYRWL